MKNLTILILFIPLFFSCKKDKLNGDSLMLEGKWKWTESSIVYDVGTPDSYYEIKSSDSFGIPDDYYLEFDRKGKVKFYKNDVIEEKYRIVFYKFEESPGCILIDCFSFQIYLDNDSDNILSGAISKDTLLINNSNIPLIDQTGPGSTIYYTHRYIRVN